MCRWFWVAVAAGVVALSSAAHAQEAAPAEFVQLIDRWYAELRKLEDGRPYLLLAPGSIDASPYIDYIDNGSAALGPRIFTSLPARAHTFAHRIIKVRQDATFARIEVDERGYFCAWSIPTTYESASSSTFVLERQDDGRWLILAHQTGSYGMPPGTETDPMPDLCTGDPKPVAVGPP